MSRTFQHTLIVIFTLVFIGGCSTEKNTRLSRTYHNITSHYNVYFNGEQSLKSGVEKIDKSVDDDFTKLLLVYKSNDPGTGNVAKSDMENAILKASKLIKIHSITKKPKRRRHQTRAYKKLASKNEFNNWVDDSYILMGKAYFYMKNYNSAIENFTYVVRKFSEEETKYEAYIWLIRAYTQVERYNDALDLIKSINASEDFPSKYDEEFALAAADYYIHQKEYKDAIPQLQLAIKKSHRKKDKVRYKYILAQLYEETGQSELATETFRDVAKMNPPYQMAFNARINAAGAFAGKGDVSKLKKQLRKMLRDSKNVEYRDQIYFALANIFMAEGNKQVAIDDYRKSAAASSKNVYQRALSCLTLADIYFDDKNYKGAQSYYDSAMVVIDNTYPNYPKIVDRYNSLTRLTDNLYTVQREDSLQRIAALSEDERNKLIDKWIKEAREEEQRKQQMASAQMQDRNFFQMNRSRIGLGGKQQGSSWYFYNPTTVAYGKVEFEKLWGKRKLEDNWRRSNKHAASEFETLAQDSVKTATDSLAVKRIKDPKERTFYMQDLPLTKEKMAASNDRIRDALFNAGRIFKTDFDNYQRSIQEYEDLLDRYKDNIYQLTSYFELWDLYKKVGNQEKSDYYKNLIINNFPDSKYAKYLVNPNFFIELEAREDSMNNLYQKAFYNYQRGEYQQAGQLSQQIKGMNPDSTLLAKVDYIQTIAKGTATSDWNQFETDLNGYITTFPKSSTLPLAKEVLKLIQDSTLADYQKLVEIGYLNDKIQNQELLPENQASKDEFGGKFSYDEDLQHYFVIAFPRSANVDLNRL
ncbi:MAG TPA: tetratricopeptide repeat protein, partial [Sunxiuqinia sp.]|nr:tetratricopeptide repeat protein [Sunxiuqinia sp.]